MMSGIRLCLQAGSMARGEAFKRLNTEDLFLLTKAIMSVCKHSDIGMLHLIYRP
ncbi:MAG: hypothetical protein DDT19_00577 [Syntrophomonadaceae bacterium]|nr:hypothetical protein [Bacillota bacterium]